MEDRKKHWGDRKDGYLIRDLDAMHYVMPHIYPNRCDNEAYISQRVDLTAINAYLAQKNELETEFPYTIFHLIVAAIIKTITLRPKMNRFIANKTMYQRKEVSAAFVVKKQFNDGSEEGLAFLHAKPEETLDTLHTQLKQHPGLQGREQAGQLQRRHGSVQQDAPLPLSVPHLGGLQAGQARACAQQPHRHRPLLRLGGAV